MATNKRRERENRQNIMEDLLNVQRGLFLAGIEGVSALADATRDFVAGTVQNQPFSTSNTVGDVLRETPETLNAATTETTERLVNLPRRMVDAFYREYSSAPTQRLGGGSRRGTANPESIIVDSAQAYLDSIPQGGALVNSLVNNVVLTTGYPADIVRAVVLRNFVSNGTVVRNQEIGNPYALQNPVIVRMRQQLTDLGYTDLRLDCPLRALPDASEKAALVAFDGDTPLVLCYPVVVGDVNSPAIREAARFQAAALDPNVMASFVWVSDGVSSYYLDTKNDIAIAALPPFTPSSGTTRGRA